MKRVVFFIESFSGGGAERVLLTILRNIDLTRFDVTVLVVSDSGVYSRDFHSLGIKIVPLMGNGTGLLGKIKYKLIYEIVPPSLVCKWLLRGLEADTYVAFVEGYCTKIFSYIPDKYKKIAWVHTDLETFPWTLEKGIYKSVTEEAEAYHRYEEVIGVSGCVSDVLRTRYGLGDVTTIYNPIDENRIKSLSECDSTVDVDKSKFNIVSVGRLTKPKGYDKLIALMPDIISANPDVRLYIIGEGEDHSSLEVQIKSLALQNNVVLTGFMDNPYSLMKEMDLFVCSSRAEGFSLVIAEAMTVGLPVVSMECAGPNDLLGGGKYGVLCSDYEDLAKSILQISKSSVMLESLKAKVEERDSFFDTGRIVKEIESIL